MAKQRLFLVRDGDSVLQYGICVGKKPNRERDFSDDVWSRVAYYFCFRDFEEVTPKYLYLPPGGGPKEIRLVEVKRRPPRLKAHWEGSRRVRRKTGANQ